jgi:hypothetical protein
VSPVRYELGFCIPEGDILHSHRCENLKSYINNKMLLISSESLYSLPGQSSFCLLSYLKGSIFGTGIFVITVNRSMMEKFLNGDGNSLDSRGEYMQFSSPKSP